MHYLSVHDLVWINAVVTGKTIAYDYEKLETAMAAQYSYGDSNSVPAQAANLLECLILKPPFAGGSRRTAYVSLAVFVVANGRALKVGDAQAADTITRVAAQELTPADAVEELSAPAAISLRSGATLRQLVTRICNEHPDALRRLAKGDE